MALIPGRGKDDDTRDFMPDAGTAEMGERVYAEFKRYRATVKQIRDDCQTRLISAERMFAQRVESIVQMDSPLQNGEHVPVESGEQVPE